MLDYYTIAVIAILAAISPGPDFAVVAKNAIGHHRQAAVMTSLGIGGGILVHSTYCVLGLAVVISQSLLIFSIIKYIGAAYLIYLGVKSLFSKTDVPTTKTLPLKTENKTLSDWQAFKNGLLVNVLNPKCTLFMLSVFTVIVRPNTPMLVQASYGILIALITAGWFVFLSIGLTHAVIKQKIEKVQHIVTKAIGVVLVGLGIFVIFESR